jgi:C1A family cysteine protease
MRAVFVFVAVLAVLCACASSASASASLLGGDDAVFLQFQDYMTKFNKVYKSMEEMLDRFENFKNSTVRIAARNRDQPGQGVFGINKFSDMSVEEFRATHLGFVPYLHKNKRNVPVKKPRSMVAPTSFDWRTKGAVTPVKDQGQCGSCWAFSATEEIESMWFLSNGTLPVLSPQQVTSCDKTDGGCNGGDTPTAYQYVKSSGGLESNKDYPYTSGTSGQTGSCKFDKTKVVASIKGFSYATPPCTDSCSHQDEATLAANLAQTGPVSICVYAESWMDYQSGILNSNCPNSYSSLDHCVQLVGYNKAGSIPYWIVRNSWNTNWGVNGYIYIQSGSNLCGVADEATFATI